MTETRIRELFTDASHHIAVPPAPRGDTFVVARRSRTRRVTVWGGVAAAAAAGVVLTVTMLDETPGSAPAPSPAQSLGVPTNSLLDCRNDKLSTSTWEAAGPYRRTPEGLAKLFANPIANEHAVLQSVGGHSARALMLRGDESRWARLTLGYLPGRGWRLESAEACAGRFVRLYWQHQSQP